MDYPPHLNAKDRAAWDRAKATGDERLLRILAQPQPQPSAPDFEMEEMLGLGAAPQGDSWSGILPSQGDPARPATIGRPTPELADPAVIDALITADRSRSGDTRKPDMTDDARSGRGFGKTGDLSSSGKSVIDPVGDGLEWLGGQIDKTPVYTGAPEVEPYFGAEGEFADFDIDDFNTGPETSLFPKARPEREGGSSGKPTGAGVESAPVDTTPVKPNKMNGLQRWTEEKFGWDEDKRSDIGRALLEGGLATMAGNSPDWAQNVGKGGLVGAQAYFDAGDERYERGLKEDALAMQKELHDLRMAEGARAAEKHELAIAKAKEIAAKGPEFDPQSPAGKLWADANAIADQTPGVTAEEVLQTWIEQGWQKDPRDEGLGI
jgi:hypothetical protein